MAYVLIIVGLLLTVAGVRDKQDDLFTRLENDFSGPGSFIYWLGAIGVVGGAGYIPGFKKLSNAFLVLILIVLVLNQKAGLFSALTQQLQQTTTPPNTGNTQ